MSSLKHILITNIDRARTQPVFNSRLNSTAAGPAAATGQCSAARTDGAAVGQPARTLRGRRPAPGGERRRGGPGGAAPCGSGAPGDTVYTRRTQKKEQGSAAVAQNNETQAHSIALTEPTTASN